MHSAVPGVIFFQGKFIIITLSLCYATCMTNWGTSGNSQSVNFAPFDPISYSLTGPENEDPNNSSAVETTKPRDSVESEGNGNELEEKKSFQVIHKVDAITILWFTVSLSYPVI